MGVWWHNSLPHANNHKCEVRLTTRGEGGGSSSKAYLAWYLIRILRNTTKTSFPLHWKRDGGTMVRPSGMVGRGAGVVR